MHRWKEHSQCNQGTTILWVHGILQGGLRIHDFEVFSVHGVAQILDFTKVFSLHGIHHIAASSATVPWHPGTYKIFSALSPSHPSFAMFSCTELPNSWNLQHFIARSPKWLHWQHFQCNNALESRGLHFFRARSSPHPGIYSVFIARRPFFCVKKLSITRTEGMTGYSTPHENGTCTKTCLENNIPAKLQLALAK